MTTSTLIAARRTGAGAPVVLLHPAGFGAAICEPLAERLAAHADVIVPDRRGYGASAHLAAPTSIDDTSDDLAALLDQLGVDRATVVGVSAGATLTLAFALRHPDRVAGAVSHEPLLGPMAPHLHEIVTGRIATLVEPGAAPAEQAVPVFMSELVGTPTWNRLEPAWRDLVRTQAEATRAEVALFPSFAVDAGDLERLGAAGVVSTLGARSGPPRQEAAEVLAVHGVVVRTVADTGHLPLVEEPDAYAQLVLDLISERVGS